MRKLLLLALASFLLFVNGNAQTATSIANGNWMNPFTWSCTCVPLPGYSVTINHNVMLDTSFYIPSGGITITSGASLAGNNATRDIMVNGGSLTNNGTLTVRYLWTQTGNFANSGTVNLTSFLNNVNFTNNGTFQNLDSMYTTGIVVNNGSFLNIDSITNAGTFTNNGICTYNQFTNASIYHNNNYLSFSDITNLGTFENTDTILASNSGWNVKDWTNNTGAYMHFSKSFLNAGDTTLHDAVFVNNGRWVISDSWYNADTIKGGSTGSIQVADSSVNWGAMKGTFDFCDLTPPVSAPYIDFNLGTVSSGITWCLYDGISELAWDSFTVFPNPAVDHIRFENMKERGLQIQIINMDGMTVLDQPFEESLDVSTLSQGVYMIRMTTDKTIRSSKLFIIK